MNEMNMTDEEILNNELKFLENFGITYILVNDGTMAILFIDDIHVGYVMKDDNGDYETIIQSDKYQACWYSQKQVDRLHGSDDNASQPKLLDNRKPDRQ